MTKRWLLTLAVALCAHVPAVHAQENEFPRDLHGLWWDPGDPGWATAVFDHTTAMSSALLIYDERGRPTWVVSPRLDCQRMQPPFLNVMCDGPLYRVRAPWFGADTYRTSQVQVREVGTWEGSFMTPLFGGVGPDLRRYLEFNYTLDDTRVIGSGMKPLKIQAVDPDDPFLWRDGRYSGLWGHPDEPGWGVGIFVQNAVLNAVLLVHGTDNEPRWYVVLANASAYEDRPDRIFEGDVFETRGFLPGSGYAGATAIRRVGAASVHFAAVPGEPATISYSIDGVHVSKTIARP